MIIKKATAVFAAVAAAAAIFAGCDKKDTAERNTTALTAPTEPTTDMKSPGEMLSEGVSEAGNKIREGVTDVSEMLSEGASKADDKIRDGITDLSEAVSE